MSNPPRRHHFVPQFVLWNFTDQNGFLHCYRKESNSFFKTSPKGVFLKRDLYTRVLDDGTKSTQKETDLAQVEEESSVVIKSILNRTRSDSNQEPTSSEERVLREFLNCQFNRDPEIKKSLREFAQSPDRRPATERDLGRPMDEGELKKFNNPNERDRMADDIFLETINTSGNDRGPLMRELKKKHIGIVRVSTNAGEFVIGDMPMVRIPSTRGAKYLGTPGVYLLYPISWDMAVIWGLMDGDQRLKTFDDPRWTLDINDTLIRQSHTIVGRSERLIRSTVEQLSSV